LSQLFEELKRRNVFRVAIAYLAVAWAALQFADIILDNIAAPEWLMQALMLFIVIGFPIAILFAWAFEITPEGVKKESEIDRSSSVTQKTGKKLDRVIIGVLGIAVVFLLIDKFVLSESSPATTTTDQSVAVLPFVAMSSGPDDEYFADGLTEEILNSLTRLPELLVTARTSAFHFKGQDLPVPEIAEKLGVAHIVEGSVRRQGNRLRVTAQLIRAEDGFHLWSQNYDRDTADTFGVQTDIAEKIAAALDVVMDDEQRQEMQYAGVRNPEAFVAYQKGIEAFNSAHGAADMLAGLRVANEFFSAALTVEPTFSDAYVISADYFTHFLMDTIFDENVSGERDAAMREIIELHKNAVRFAEGDEDRVVAAYDLAVITGEWGKLPALFDELIRHTVCSSTSWEMQTSIPYGLAEASLQSALKETECSPLSFNGWTQAAAASTSLGEHDAAVEIAEAGLESIQHIRIYQQLVFAHLAAGRFDEASSIIDRHIHLDSQSLSQNIIVAAALGDADLADVLLAKYLQPDSGRTRPPIVQYAVLGMRDEANELAARIDSIPHGHVLLMLYPQICACGAPWDIEKTPNFAKLIDEADFPWPPAAPIDFPLKDW
jgi:adenylate cyclase